MVEKWMELPQRLVEIETVGNVMHIGAGARRPVFDRQIASALTAFEDRPRRPRQLLRDQEQRNRIPVAAGLKLCLQMFVVEPVTNAEVGAGFLYRGIGAGEDRGEGLAMREAIFLDAGCDHQRRERSGYLERAPHPENLLR